MARCTKLREILTIACKIYPVIAAWDSHTVGNSYISLTSLPALRWKNYSASYIHACTFNHASGVSSSLCMLIPSQDCFVYWNNVVCKCNHISLKQGKTRYGSNKLNMTECFHIMIMICFEGKSGCKMLSYMSLHVWRGPPTSRLCMFAKSNTLYIDITKMKHTLKN